MATIFGATVPSVAGVQLKDPVKQSFAKRVRAPPELASHFPQGNGGRIPNDRLEVFFNTCPSNIGSTLPLKKRIDFNEP